MTATDQNEETNSMRTSGRLILALQLLLLAGCNTWGPDEHSEQRAVRANRAMVNSFFDEATENGIIAQHTIFPYHYVADTDRLNALGRSDLDVLATHFKETPGPLNIRRGGASDALYESRVAAVVALLREKGVDTDKIHISDAAAGGKGMASEQVVGIQSQKDSSPSKTSAQAQQGTISNDTKHKTK